MCGVYLNRSRIIGLKIAVLELALLLNTEIIFIAFGFDPEMQVNHSFLNINLGGTEKREVRKEQKQVADLDNIDNVHNYY